MRPPRGFEAEKFPLRHRLIYATGLGLATDNLNTVFMPIVMSSKDTDVLPNTIQVNPHNSTYEEDAGSLCAQMSIIDRMKISLKFNLTHNCETRHETAGTYGANGQTDATFEGDDISALKFHWRPIFNVYPEKLDAADDDTGDTVAAILGMTKDATNEDIVALTTNKLPTNGPSDLSHPVSTVNAVQVVADFNYTSSLVMEDHVFDETLLQTALRRYTNKGALRSCLGRTRHVTLTRTRPFANFFISKFVPRAIRRIQPYALMGIQVHMPYDVDIGQATLTRDASAGLAHLGVKMIVNYHEWNSEHDQERGTPS